MTRFRLTTAVIVLAGLPVGLHAEDYPFIAEDLPPHLAERAAAQANQLLLGEFVGPEEFFIAGIKVWKSTQSIRVCFFGGGTAIRSRIAQAANEWTTVGGYVPLDFGSLQDPRNCALNEFNHIRVGFAYKGYWSMVGTDSVNVAAQAEQSMNLALYDINPPAEPAFSQVVKHEFGHALGFQHEHQSQTAPCVDEFNWDAVYAYLQGPPNYWSIEKINHNLRPRNPQPGDASSPFDRDSIMLYSFPASFYKSGTNAQCYTPGNTAISDVDISGILQFYPANISDQAEAQQEALQGFFGAVDALANVSEEAKSFAKLTASSLSGGTNAEFTQAPFWGQSGAEQFMIMQAVPAVTFDGSLQYLSPPPRF
jgi:hypothetical protein